jgi:hypothetical protein
VGRQNFTCSTPDCHFWGDDEDGCTKGSVTIEEHHCVDFEERPKPKIAVFVKGGNVQGIYVSPYLRDIDIEVEMFDYDNASGEDDDVWFETNRRGKEVEKTYKQIY